MINKIPKSPDFIGGRINAAEGSESDNSRDFPRLVTVDDRIPKTPYSSFTVPSNYAAYVKNTNEKILLEQELIKAYRGGDLAIRPGDRCKRVLDLGCGLGTNTAWLLALFKDHDVYAIDRSKDFLEYAAETLIAPGDNLHLKHRLFEDYSQHWFDFILCSHVLQYIDSDLVSFLRKIIERLTADGEAWIVLQEEAGINEIVQVSKPFLTQPSAYFQKWFVHDRVRRTLRELGMRCETWTFPSHFRRPNVADPKDEDLGLLNFILLNGFDQQNNELVQAVSSQLSALEHSGYILHEVGITKFRRL